LRKGQTIAVEDAIRATVIRSANDVAVVIAEALGGTEGNFALQMTAKARQLGMNETNFHNASGLPSPLQITTASDMAILGRRLAYDFPQHFHYFALPGFTYKGTWYPTHDNLIGRYDGADGIKTGYTNASGFNLVSSVVRDNRHIVAVVMGGRTAIRRDLEMIRILDEAFVQVSANPTLVASRPVPWHAYGATTPVVTASLSISPQAPAQSLPQSLVTPPRSTNPFAGLMAMAPPALGGPKFEDEDSAERKVASDEDATVLSGPIARQPAVPNAVVNGPVLPAPNMVRPLARANVPAGPIPAIRPSPRPDISTEMVARNMSVVPAVRPSPRPADLAGVAVARNMSVPPPPQPRPSLQAVVPEGDTDTPQPVAGRNWTIQIGAYADQTLARAQLAAYADKARDVLGQASRIVTPAAGADGKTVWRARFGLFGEDQAREVCSRLSQRGQTCFAAVAQAR
jgi:D-alanyl-D-alanine carboxypeptidase